jgi:hypothetical protein
MTIDADLRPDAAAMPRPKCRHAQPRCALAEEQTGACRAADSTLLGYRYSVDQIKGTKFDPDSIMLYFFPGTWVKSGVGTRADDALSAMDKAFIASAEAYPKTGPVADQAVELKVDAKKRTAAAIGKAGEEDIFKFTVARGGSYAIDTRGPTDAVMKPYGPNSHTDLIAEDDDSGYGYNARIVANLVPGTYYAQVRHYNKASGMGNYTIKVRKL